MSTLHLNGTAIKGHELKVEVSLPLESKDVSGQSSKTTRVEQGDKAKTVAVSLVIKFDNEKDLSALITLAEAKNGSAERMIYTILNRTANAMSIRQVQFDGDVRVAEHDSLQLWNVSFSLAEHNSVAEKKEARVEKKKKPVTVQKAAGKTVASKTPSTNTPATTNPTPAAPVTAPELTQWEKMLQVLDNGAAKIIK